MQVMIPQETVDKILDTAQIADVVGDYVSLKRRGASLVACCPFHNEKTPSFYVTPSKGIYKCFGCGKAGTAVGFVMEMEHCEYPDALRLLAKKYNIEIQEEEESAEQIQQRQHRESLLLVSQFAMQFFSTALKSGEGRDVGYAYLRRRGLEDATIERFHLGWAPRGRRTLVDAAVAAGYKEEYLVDAGLAVRNEDGTLRDKFRERVMFPIFSVSGRVIAFSGRTLRSDIDAKYVNTADTEIYKKSNILLGIYHAKSEMARMQKCYLVEGNVDMVMMYQHGIKNVVASCGTALTTEQVRLIKRFTDNVTLMYDGDSAGIHAAEKGTPLLLSEGLNVRLVLLPDGMDPDEFCRSRSLDEVRSFFDRNECDFIEFLSTRLLQESAGDPVRKSELINRIVDIIACIPDQIKKSVYIQQTALRFGIEESLIYNRIKQEKNRNRSPLGQTAQAQEVKPVQAYEPENRLLAPAERDLLGFLLGHGCTFLDFESDSQYYSSNEEDRLTVADFIRCSFLDSDVSMVNSLYARIYDAYYELYDQGDQQDRIVKKLLDSPDRQMASQVLSLSSEKHDLTVKDFRDSLTAVPSWLVKNVPKALLVYAERRLQNDIEGLKRKLVVCNEDAEREALMKEIVLTLTKQKLIKQKLDREKK